MIGLLGDKKSDSEICEITFYQIKDIKMKHETKRPKQKYFKYTIITNIFVLFSEVIK
jgi:hypothetical protein